MSDNYSMYDSSGNVVFEVEIVKSTDPRGVQVEKAVFTAPNGEMIGEMTASIDEKDGDKKSSLYLNRMY